MNLLRFMNNLKLRTKFVIPISLLLTASILVISIFLINRQSDGYRRELETSGGTMIRVLANHAESGVIFEDKSELEKMLSLLGQFPDVEYAAITAKSGKLLAEVGTPVNGCQTLRPIEHFDLGSEMSSDFYVRDSNGIEYIELNYPIRTRKQSFERESLGITSDLGPSISQNYVTEEIGNLRLLLGLGSVNKAIADSTRTAVMMALIVAILTILTLTFFVSFVTKPLKMLVEITDKVSHGDLSQKADLDQKDEIGHLAKTFNHMIMSLRQSRDEIEEYNRNLEQKIIERTLELEEIQAQLVQSEKLSAIGQLAAGVAHELNNPLGGILGYAQFALEKMTKSARNKEVAPDYEKYMRYLKDIETQARRCKTIVQNLLRFSRASRTTDLTDVDVNQVVEDTVTFVEHQLHMQQIEMQVQINRQIPNIQGNAGQLQQVLTNLILNAMHASPPESTVTVVSRFSPALGEFEGAVEILVSDQGTGIAPENLKKIFEPFFTTKAVGKGTGLGLSVSYGIVKEHGGEIKVSSSLGEGSTFIVVLPVQNPDESSDNPDKERKQPLTDRTGAN